jgi:hypothetical protein
MGFNSGFKGLINDKFRTFSKSNFGRHPSVSKVGSGSIISENTKPSLLPIFMFRVSFSYIVPPQIHTFKVSNMRFNLIDGSVHHTCHFDRSVSNIPITWITIGRAVAAAFVCQFLTIKASVQLPDRPYGTCIGHPGTRFCPSSSISPVTIFPPRLHIHSSLIRVLENGTVKRRSTTACLIASWKKQQIRQRSHPFLFPVVWTWKGPRGSYSAEYVCACAVAGLREEWQFLEHRQGTSGWLIKGHGHRLD